MGAEDTKRLLLIAAAIAIAAPFALISGEAEAGQWCGPAGRNISWAISDRTLFRNFNSACQAHDYCYGTPGANRRLCDDIFLGDMRTLCKQRYPKKVKHFLFRQKCYSDAGNYYAAVRSKALLDRLRGR